MISLILLRVHTTRPSPITRRVEAPFFGNPVPDQVQGCVSVCRPPSRVLVHRTRVTVGGVVCGRLDWSCGGSAVRTPSPGGRRRPCRGVNHGSKDVLP